MSIYPDINPSTDISAVPLALISPDAAQRRSLGSLLASLNVPVREYAEYPNAAALDELLDLGCDVFIVDLNGSTEAALGVVESICSHNGSATVMAYATSADSELLMRSMRAGAREFLIAPVVPAIVTEALSRALVRREKNKRQKAAGKVFAFVGTKGGAGATMVSTNFAIALGDESHDRVVVVDLDIHLGEVALALGLTPKFSILDALQNVDRLDSVFLLSLLGKHTSGVSVLAAPEAYTSFDNIPSAVERILRILRDEFAFVIVDAGPAGGSVEGALFDLSDTIYLITETSIPALRNARRMLSFVAGRERSPHPEVILNRFNSKEVDIDENSVAKALGRPADWRIPNDFSAVRSAENAGIPIAMKNSAITRVLRQMAKGACGKSGIQDKKGKSLLGLFE